MWKRDRERGKSKEIDVIKKMRIGEIRMIKFKRKIKKRNKWVQDVEQGTELVCNRLKDGK